jgi:hypothetical protein
MTATFHPPEGPDFGWLLGIYVTVYVIFVIWGLQ